MTVQRQPDIDLSESMVMDQASPFTDGVVDGLFFPGGGRQEALEQLTHLLRYGPSLLLLHGDEGIGKHYLIDRMISSLDLDLFDMAMVQAEVLMSADSVLSGLTGPWHCRAPLALENLQEQLIDSATVADDESRVLLLVVRHAQFLDQSSVELLSLILAYSAGLPVKILLVMESDDPDELEQFGPLFERVPDHFRLHLAPFTRAETREYLDYRMRTGGMGVMHFNDEQFQRIFNLSLGNALRINEVAGEMLRAALEHGKEGGDKLKLPWMHVGALGAMLVLLLVLVFTRGETEEVAVESATADLPATSVQSKEQADKQADNQASPAAASSGQSVTKSPAAEAEPAPEIKPEAAASTEKSPAAETGTVQVEQQAVQPKPAVKIATPKPVSAPSSNQPRQDDRAAWILSLPAEHYALQLLGAREKATVDKFLAAYPSVQKLTYYRAKRNGAPWYVVVQASFPDYDSAKAAVTKLPQKLQKQGPWIRKIEAIQKDLKN